MHINPIDIDAITTVLTFIMLISNFILMLTMWVDKAKAPEKSQNDRISSLESRVDDLYDNQLKEKDRIKELEKSDVITQEAILALMSHAIDGNHVEELKKAKLDLQKYLTHKGVNV